jgi:hypothetical protein
MSHCTTVSLPWHINLRQLNSLCLKFKTHSVFSLSLSLFPSYLFFPHRSFYLKRPDKCCRTTFSSHYNQVSCPVLSNCRPRWNAPSVGILCSRQQDAIKKHNQALFIILGFHSSPSFLFFSFPVFLFCSDRLISYCILTKFSVFFTVTVALQAESEGEDRASPQNKTAHTQSGQTARQNPNLPTITLLCLDLKERESSNCKVRR